MFDMYDNVFTHNKLKDVKIRPCTGPHQTFANVIRGTYQSYPLG